MTLMLRTTGGVFCGKNAMVTLSSPALLAVPRRPTRSRCLRSVNSARHWM